MCVLLSGQFTFVLKLGQHRFFSHVRACCCVLFFLNCNTTQGTKEKNYPFLPPTKSKSKNVCWKTPACIKERLSTGAHTSQSPTGSPQHCHQIPTMLPTTWEESFGN